jgi:hypothetical protein
MSVHWFYVPGEAARREYAVYLIVARHRWRNVVKVYVGKTGDNREGCNPVISRAGNHLSFNPLHAQSRNHLRDPENYDFDFFFTSFGRYIPPSRKLSRHVTLAERRRREALATPARLARLRKLIAAVKQFTKRNL